jgi:hypothetical protein
MNPALLSLILAALRGVAIVLVIGLIAGTAVYTQSSSVRLALVAGVSAGAAEGLRLLVPAAAAGTMLTTQADRKPSSLR